MSYFSFLNFIESESICGTNASSNDGSIVENDYLELRCKIRYVGGLHPRMEWQRSDGEHLIANSTYSPQELYSVITQQMKAKDNTINYTATTFFETTSASYEGVEAASNKPEYKWVFSTNVLCKKCNKYNISVDEVI